MKLLTMLYHLGSYIHRQLYILGIKKKIQAQKPVFSVGNLSFGGTGKTPFVLNLVEELQNLGLNPAIVVGSYKASTEVTGLMDSEKSEKPQIWGDEACWYFEKTQVPVYSGPEKWESAILAGANSSIDLILVDDGFQHHPLKKDLEIVLIDAAAGISALNSKSREGLSALKFASCVVLTRCNLVQPQVLEDFKRILPADKQLFLNSTVTKKLRDLNGKEFQPQGSRVGLICGIANPESFLTVFRQKFPSIQAFSLEFDDHHNYTQEDLNKIEKFRLENNLDFIVTTEKDEIKIKRLKSFLNEWTLKNLKILQVESQFENRPQWIQYLKARSEGANK